ncbi:MAG TPA: FAD:protein FMN transferase [Candidatus Omnitrophota bacterium]|nr:FAD:protein FMN transferase [Candidatus Omnitrophota bacterium]HPT07849.1 FAD:protein FMN transferase [Candidatus Omnitrophota bacterium]
MKKWIVCAVVCLTGFSLCGCRNHDFKETRMLMGTYVEITSSDWRAAAIAFDEIKRIEDLLSKYNEKSEISRLNRIGKSSVSVDTLYIVRKAKQLWLVTGGAFDPTVGPLLDVWGFTDKKYRFPSDEEIASAMKKVGMDKVEIDDEKNIIALTVPGMKLDLGGIAKGYAVDCAVSRLKQAHVRNCLINAGGDIYCLGKKADGRAWRVALRDPRREQYAVRAEFFELSNKAIDTSGDYEQFFIKDNKRYSHIFDPKTGRPASSGVASVTVIAPDCLTADALATSLFVMGKDKGRDLLKKFPMAEANIIDEKDVQDSE